MKWINSNDASIDEYKDYLVMAIGGESKSHYFLYKPQIMAGWAFKRLRPGCYAGVEYIAPSQEELIRIIKGTQG